MTKTFKRKGPGAWTKKCLSLTLAFSMLLTLGFTDAIAATKQGAAAAANNALSDDNLLTRDGLPNGHIVLPSGASEMERYAAQELQSHINLVSGATLPITTKDLEESDFTASLSPAAVSAPEIGY